MSNKPKKYKRLTDLKSKDKINHNKQKANRIINNCITSKRRNYPVYSDIDLNPFLV